MYVIGDKDSNFIIVSRVSVYSGINIKKLITNDKFVINDDCIVENMFEDSNIDDLSPLEEPNLEAEGEEL